MINVFLSEKKSKTFPICNKFSSSRSLGYQLETKSCYLYWKVVKISKNFFPINDTNSFVILKKLTNQKSYQNPKRQRKLCNWSRILFYYIDISIAKIFTKWWKFLNERMKGQDLHFFLEMRTIFRNHLFRVWGQASEKRSE